MVCDFRHTVPVSASGRTVREDELRIEGEKICPELFLQPEMPVK